MSGYVLFIRGENKMEYILSLSYGKDSLACLGAIEELGWPLDRIVHAEVWATDTIPADLPEMVEFKAKADKIIKERWGIEVEHVCRMSSGQKITYKSVFYRIRTQRSANPGKIYGWPTAAMQGVWCTGELKQNILKKTQKTNVVYLGIAADEPDRFHNLTETKKSPLVEAGWDEAYCRKWCEENDLLSPIYTTATRGGCWFCPNQRVNQLRLLRKNYPDLWALMLKWDDDSPVTFHADGHTVHDFERRFEMEDKNLVPKDRCFRWKMLEENKMNYSKIIEKLLDLSKKQVQNLLRLGVKSEKECAITIKKGKKKYYCYFNICYMLFSDEPFNIPVVRENKKMNDILLKILKGGCSKAKYSGVIDMNTLNTVLKQNKGKGTFTLKYGAEYICMNAAWLKDCLNFVGTNKIYFNNRLSPVVFKNEGEELKRFGILIPIRKL